jgi:hypothetical protein
MCRQVECPNCKKPTYAGCGMHIEQVLGDVPRERRCDCREKAKTAKTAPAEAVVEPSFLRRIFGG